MKTKLLILVLCILMIGLCGCTVEKTTKVDADVLAINAEILEGELIGRFLGSSDGWIRSDVIKVGVKFEINGNLFLEDLKLSHAQLAYYKDANTLPLKITIIFDKVVESQSWIIIRLNGYHIKDCRICATLAKDIVLEMNNEL